MNDQTRFQKLLIMAIISTIIGCSTLDSSFQPQTMSYILQVTKKLGKSRAERLKSIRDTHRDVIVIDYSEHGDKESKWTKAEIDSLKNGGATKVVCYLSIGEAEDYRWYWQKQWNKNRPDFLCAENKDWPGNFKVKYWQSEWQKVILGYLDEIIAQGFDGVYLDIIDAFQFFEYDENKKDWIDNRINSETQQTFRRDMVEGVRTISDHAKTKRSGFVVIPQNGSELLVDQNYIAAIDAIGIEDLFTSGNKPQSDYHTKSVLHNLALIKAVSKPVLLIEYPVKKAMCDLAEKKAAEHGLGLLITDRPLKTLGSAK